MICLIIFFVHVEIELTVCTAVRHPISVFILIELSFYTIQYSTVLLSSILTVLYCITLC